MAAFAPDVVTETPAQRGCGCALEPLGAKVKFTVPPGTAVPLVSDAVTVAVNVIGWFTAELLDDPDTAVAVPSLATTSASVPAAILKSLLPGLGVKDTVIVWLPAVGNG